MNPYLYHQDDPARQRASLPPHLQPFPPQGPIVFPTYHHPSMSPFPLSYPLHPVPFNQLSPFVPQQYPHVQRPIPSTLLNDPAFSPDPRSNPHFFSMNDREEIYPAAGSDSLSDYAPTVADDESEVDHFHLPPRMRILNTPDASPPPPRHHARSQSTPYVPPQPSQQNLSRSTSARVIPIPPPISRASTPGSHLHRASREDPHPSGGGSSPVYASASLAAKELWQPPPPYSDSETESSYSSNPQTPAGTPPSSSSHLPHDASKMATPPPIEKRASSQPRPPPVATIFSASPPSQPNNGKSPTKTSIVQSTVTRPPITPRNASAPELHPPPPPVDVPSRPSTVPIPAAPPQSDLASAPRTRPRRNSKNPSIATPPRDLDSIDELDESDPLGFAWHHDGPYEAIARAAPALYPDSSGVAAQKRLQTPKRKPVQPYDVSLGVSPGQIFPSFSHYQPQSAGSGVPQQFDPNVVPPMPPSENFPVGSPPTSPVMLPVQRRVPPSGPVPTTPDQYSNLHMTAMNAPPVVRNAPLPDQQGSRMQQQQQQQVHPPQPVQPQAPPAYSDAPQPSPPLTNPHSPAQSDLPDTRPSRQDAPAHSSRPVSLVHPGPDPKASNVAPHPNHPPTNVVPRPDVSLPLPRQGKQASSPPRYLPRKLVMPAPLQQSTQQNQRLQPGQAHVEILAQRHGPAISPKQSAPTNTAPITTAQQQQQQQQHARAQSIPISNGPNVLKKRHTIGVDAPQAEVPASNTTAAMFAARVRFAEPAKEETKEERKRREKEEAKREKEEAKREKEEAKREKERAKARIPREMPLEGMFTPDYVKEAEMAKMNSSKATGRKLSKRR